MFQRANSRKQTARSCPIILQNWGYWVLYTTPMHYHHHQVPIFYCATDKIINKHMSVSMNGDCVLYVSTRTVTTGKYCKWQTYLPRQPYLIHPAMSDSYTVRGTYVTVLTVRPLEIYWGCLLKTCFFHPFYTNTSIQMHPDDVLVNSWSQLSAKFLTVGSREINIAWLNVDL